jgi:hypothetical protein
VENAANRECESQLGGFVSDACLTGFRPSPE